MTSDHIIIEYLPGDEYTIDCFTDYLGNLCFVGPRNRLLIRAGISIMTGTTEDIHNEFYDIAQKINETLPFVGAWFFQVKQTKTGELCLMEIAPRIAGAMFLYREQGVNFPLLSIYAHMQLPTKIIKPSLSHVVGCKIYKNRFYLPQFISNPIVAFYVDLDDTIILTDLQCVNPSIISLLYESKMAKIPIYLITRHKNIVEETLEKLCIHMNIFDKIIHIMDKSNKKDYIIHKPALFLDDSFSERDRVAADNIFTFDVDSYEIIRDIIKTSHTRLRITHE
jgi:hypothetical protein